MLMISEGGDYGEERKPEATVLPADLYLEGIPGSMNLFLLVLKEEGFLHAQQNLRVCAVVPPLV